MKKLVLFLLIASVFTSCEEKEPNDPGKNHKAGELVKLLESPMQEPYGTIAASMDGKYFGNHYDYNFYFTTDEGKNWDKITTSTSYTYQPDVHSSITSGGFLLLTTRGKSSEAKLFNLNSKKELTIKFEAGFGSYKNDGFYPGSGDYIYAQKSPDYYFQEIGQSEWKKIPFDPDVSYNNAAYYEYVGQDVKNGGAAYIDREKNALFIHNPGDNTVNRIDYELDLTKIYKRVSGGDAPSQMVYDGFGVLLAADNLGFARIGLNGEATRYSLWKDHYKRGVPSSVGIDSDGVVYFRYLQENHKAQTESKAARLDGNDRFEGLLAITGLCVRGKNAFFISAPMLHRLSKAGESRMYTNPTNSRAEFLDFKSTREIGGEYYTLMSFTVKDISYNGLFRVNKQTEHFDFIHESSQENNYIFSEGSRIFVYGIPDIIYSTDGGKNWQKKPWPARNKFVRYITKSGSTYYAVAGGGSNLGSKDPAEQFNLVVFSSKDLLSWEFVSGKNEHNLTNAAEVMTPSGFAVILTYSEGVRFFMETRDYGKNWNFAPEPNYYFNAEHKGNVYSVVRGDSDKSIYIHRYDEKYKQLSEQKVANTDTKNTSYKNLHFNDKKDLYFIGWRGFYKIPGVK